MNGRILLYGHAAKYRLGTSYLQAFERIGWKVELLDLDELEAHVRPWLQSRVGRRLTAGSLTLRRLGSRRWNDRLRERARALEPDLVFLISAQMVMPETVRAVRDASGKVAVFFPDDPLPGASGAWPEQFEAAREADRAFVWSRKLAGEMEEEGAAPVEYLPFAWDPKVFPYIAQPKERDWDVVFVGGWDRHRERWLEPVAREFELRIWGPTYWGERTRPDSHVRAAWQGRALRGEEAARVIAGSPVVLNVLREQNLPDGTNMRTFEVPGAGGFLLASRTGGAREIYPEGEAAAYFGSHEELTEKISFYLEHSAERRKIARRAHEITRSNHRYVHRARRILGAVGVTGR